MRVPIKVLNIGSNQTQVHLGSDKTFLISYKTVVAAHIDGVWMRTNVKWSKTTSKHINGWLPVGVDVQKVNQEKLEYEFGYDA